MISHSLGRKTNSKMAIKFEINKELECEELIWEKLEGNHIILNNDVSNNRNDSETDSNEQ